MKHESHVMSPMMKPGMGEKEHGAMMGESKRAAKSRRKAKSKRSIQSKR